MNTITKTAAGAAAAAAQAVQFGITEEKTRGSIRPKGRRSRAFFLLDRGEAQYWDKKA